MGIFFVYILKASVCLALFYLFYRVLLSKETFHKFNRVAVLGILMLAMLVPFCEITIKTPTEITEAMMSLEHYLLLAALLDNAGTGEVATPTITWVQVLLLVYLSGVLFFWVRYIYLHIRLTVLLRKMKRQQLADGAWLLTHSDEKLAPFSWMKYIVIADRDVEENGREIIAHELAHIAYRHSWDLLLADICIVFQWFNPAAWLLKQELQSIHEYQADESVINQGIDAKKYQLLLIKKAVGTRLYSMANSFNQSKLKKRITMMLKEKSNPWARLKYLYVLPLAAIAMSAFARPEISKELNEISATKVNNLVTIAETIVQEKEPVKAGTYTVCIDSSQLFLQMDDARVVGDTVVVSNSDIKIVGRKGKASIPPSKQPLLIVDGKEASFSLLSAINETSIESMDVYKGEAAIAKYGESAKNGVVVITLKSSEEIKKSKVTVTTGKGMVLNGKVKLNGTLVDLAADGNKPIYVIDGQEATSETMQAVNLNSIKSMQILKDASATEKYGEKAKNGVIIIKLHEEATNSDDIDVNVSVE
ncbi:M56 family metallopeptidase [Bacteroides sp. 214]|uniref:M56 family metallopeptidase n=1 Tax=Bacteroides sp. 214 TaxID=2302935 RepID=UPI0013D18FAE|nr:M56 family metallopeptidase [Bacteroides sp. 214]